MCRDFTPSNNGWRNSQESEMKAFPSRSVAGHSNRWMGGQIGRPGGLPGRPINWSLARCWRNIAITLIIAYTGTLHPAHR